MDLELEIRGWDHKSASAIKCIYDRHSSRPEFAASLVSMSASPDTETGATWMLKRYLETAGASLSPGQTRQLASSFEGLTAWEAKLHCLQSLPSLALPGDCAEIVSRFVLACSRSDNKFVRAWAYSGLQQLAQAFPAYQKQARSILESAMATETAASAKVRLRRALNQEFPAGTGR